MLRRLTLPVVLTLTMLVAGFQAWNTDRSSQPSLATQIGDAPHTNTPLFSVRRAPSWLQQPTADRLFRGTLDTIVAASPADTCLVVHDNGRVLYEHNPAMPLVPASTVKLLTAVAALDQLGPQATFDTTAVTLTSAQGGVLNGNLWVIGGGDPILSTADYIERFGQPQPFTNAATLAERIAASGITQIRGDIVGDESRYDTARYVASWDPSFIAAHESGPLSALALNNGFSAFPKSKFNTTATPAEDPARQAAGVLRQLLVQRGVKVTGTAQSGKAPSGATEVARVSATLTDVITEMLSQSDNYTAESLTKELGVHVSAQGSTAAGVAATHQVLVSAGLPLQGVSVVDGSGLDRANRMTCTLLAAVLDRAGSKSAIASSLPIGGRTGTLAERFLGTSATGRIHAKTGSLRNSRALAGFADAGPAAEPHTLTFAYIANQTNLNAEANLHVQDQLGVGLTAYPQGPSLADLSPR